MPEVAPAETRPAADIVRSVAVRHAGNGICFADYGDTRLPGEDLERLMGAVPRSIAAVLQQKAYFFVPLAMTDNGEVRISPEYSESLGDVSSCHRNFDTGGSQYVFISTRLSPDRFATGYEFFINVAHAFVDAAGVSHDFSELVWKQALAQAKGETSLDAYELRRQALPGGTTGRVDEKAKNEYLSAAFSDSLAIYMLSLAMDVEYFELRERDYPLLAPKQLAERLRMASQLFPPEPGYEFAVQYRRRGERER